MFHTYSEKEKVRKGEKKEVYCEGGETPGYV